MTRILVISEKYWSEGGGAELATHRILEYLNSQGFEITVLTGTPNPSSISGIKYVYEPLLRASKKIQLWMNCLILKNTHKFRKLVENADIVYIPGISYPLLTGLKDRKIVIHLHNYQPIQYTQFIPAPYEDFINIIGTPIIDYYMGKLEYGSWINGALSLIFSLINKLNKEIIKRADTIICPSKRQKEIITLKIPELSEKILIIPNPPPVLNTKNFNKSVTPTIIYTGGRSRVKGSSIALKTVSLLAKEYKFKAYMLGISAQQKVIKMGSSKILLYPKLPHDMTLYLLSLSWILLFPSIIEEPFPYTVYEAAFLGVLPLATSVGGVPEILKGTVGQEFLINLNDHHSDWIKKLDYVLSISLDSFIDISKTLAKEIRERFDEKNISNAYLKCFRNM
jgi:glycosyltransferase involved in cell wall biosynthesis